MTFLFLALLLMLLSWILLSAGRVQWSRGLSFFFLFFLALWMLQEVDLFSLGRDEEALLAWSAVALFLMLLSRLELWLGKRPLFSPYLVLLSILALALALDFLHPDRYGLWPASIMGLFLALLSFRVSRRLAKAVHVSPLWMRLIPLFLNALLLYAAFYKLFDRNWFLPWSYMMAAGASLFALAQLWTAWRALGLTSETWRRRIAIAADLGIFLMVFSALNHYSQYI